MIGRERILDSLTKAVKWSKADQTLISCYCAAARVTRFHDLRIHQDIESPDIEIFFKVDLGGRIGISSTGSLNPVDLKEALDAACRIARHVPKIKIRAKFPSVKTQPAIITYYPRTADMPSDKRIENIAGAFETAKRYGLGLAGSFLTAEEEMAVVNSYNDAIYQPSTACELRLIALDRAASSSGFSSQLARDVAQIDWNKNINEAVKICLAGRNPKEVEPARYDCLMEPEAVGEILRWLGFIGFGAKQFYEKTSFMSGNIERRIMSDKITITDDGLCDETLAIPFDFEGTPRQKVTLIKRGVAKEIVYDSHYGLIYKKASTGHGLLPDETEGPLPLNLIMEPGSKTVEEMKRSMKKGVLVTRFNYVNGLLNTKEALMTGLTRDGTFLIENGKIRKPLKNLRFTESMLRALSNVISVSKERRLTGAPFQDAGTCLVPALLIKDFTFTGSTK